MEVAANIQHILRSSALAELRSVVCSMEKSLKLPQGLRICFFNDCYKFSISRVTSCSFGLLGGAPEEFLCLASKSLNIRNSSKPVS